MGPGDQKAAQTFAVRSITRDSSIVKDCFILSNIENTEKNLEEALFVLKHSTSNGEQDT